MQEALSVQTQINAPISSVWEAFTNPVDIQHWNAASSDWHCPKASNNLTVGGKFSYRMAAKDNSFAFDFSGTYTQIEPMQLVAYTLDDDRKVSIEFIRDGESTYINEIFEPESQNPVDFQKSGWQAILDNFKKYVEGQYLRIEKESENSKG